MGTAPYYTSDFRLSAEDDYSYGLKATWKAAERVQLVASYEEVRHARPRRRHPGKRLPARRESQPWE
jgi:hypothetical protein